MCSNMGSQNSVIITVMKILLRKYWPVVFIWMALILWCLIIYIVNPECGTDGPFNLCGRNYYISFIVFYGIPVAVTVTILFPIFRYFCMDTFERKSK